MALETLNNSPESFFWTSPDVILASSVIVPPLAADPTVVKVLIPQESISNLLKNNPSIIDRTFQTTTRSRWAQLGLEFDNWELRFSDLLNKQIDLNGKIDATALIRNYSQRSVQLDEGSGLFKLYHDNGARIVNGELEDAFRSGDIVIEGEPGSGEENNWDWVYGDRKNNITGVKMRIADEKKWIAPSQQAGPIHIDDEARNFRQEISQYLTDVPESASLKLWFGRTKSRLTLKGNIHAILHPVVNSNSLDSLSTIGAHLNSHVLYPNNTDNWQIILEIMSTTAEGQTPEYAHFHFVKSS